MRRYNYIKFCNGGLCYFLNFSTERIIRGQEPVGVQETLMIAKHETCIDFYGASERWI